MGRGTFLPWIWLYRQHVLLNYNIIATDLHFLLGTEGLDLGIGTSSDSGVLDVEAARMLVIANFRAKLKSNEKKGERLTSSQIWQETGFASQCCANPDQGCPFGRHLMTKSATEPRVSSRQDTYRNRHRNHHHRSHRLGMRCWLQKPRLCKEKPTVAAATTVATTTTTVATTVTTAAVAATVRL